MAVSNAVLEDRYKNMEKVLNKVDKRLDELPKNYVTRLEFKAAAAVLGLISVTF